MKRLLPAVPLVLLLVLNACGSDSLNVPAAQWTAIWQTETAKAWTSVPTATPHPAFPTMVNSLNIDLSSTTNSLEATMDAEYSVTDISFRNIPNSSALIFRVDVSCVCKNSAECCIPGRTFVVIMESMKRTLITNFVQVPPGVRQMMVVSFDPKAKSQIGAISAPWQDVQSYLYGNLLGDQLGVRVTRTVAP